MGIFKDENGRSYGDWTHRGQGRTRENANDIAGADADGEQKWYHQTFWVIFSLVIFWPVGLYLMWRGTWPVAVKVIVTIAIVALVVVSYQMSQAVMAAQVAGA